MNFELIGSFMLNFPGAITIDCERVEISTDEVEVISPSKIYFCKNCQLNFQSDKKLKTHYENVKCSRP